MGKLEEIRSILRFTQVEVENAAGWPGGRLSRIEQGDDPSDEESDVLTRLYGVEVESLISGDDGDSVQQPLAALLRGPAETLAGSDRFEIAEVATIAREHRQLLAALGRRDQWPAVAGFRDDGDYSYPSGGSPERLATRLRAGLRLQDGPIPSIWDLARTQLGVLVVWVDLPSHIDAFALAGPDTGAAFALNANGAHTGNAFTRRVTLAHEICHVLFDRSQMRSMGRFCDIAVGRRGRRQPRHDDLPLEEKIERRARAFAAALLVPRADGIKIWNRLRDRSPARKIKDWMGHWGIGYEAARGHLDTLGCLPVGERVGRVQTDVPAVWERAEPGPPRGDLAAKAGVPLNRRGDFFTTVLDAVREHAIAPSRAREHLLIDRAAWDSLVQNLAAPPVHRPAEEVSSSVLSDWL
jgi:Zn-dependent peptidase ImmA (M78 family)